MAAALAVIEGSVPGPGVAWILGEPGIGKTRLAAHLAQLADREGTRVLFGRCDEDLSVPLQPFVEILRAATDALDGPELARVVGPSAGELVRLVPELGDRLGGTGPAAAADADTERHRLLEAVDGWIAAMTTGGPYVLVVDDAHWATDSTVQMLAHLLRSGRPSQVTLVVTARDTSPDDSPRLAELVAATAAQQGTVIRLSGLEHDAVRELVPVGSEVGPVIAATAGNPLLIGAMVDDPAAGATVGAAVHRRISRLADSARDTLVLAAVAGLEFDLRVLAAATRRDEFDLLDDLEHAAAARLVDEVAVDTYRFSHALVRSSLRDDLGASRRARHHRRLAEAIEEVAGADVDRHAPALALHWSASGPDAHARAKVVEYASIAAARAVEMLSFEEADALYATALAAVGDDELVTRASVLRARGWSQARAGKHIPAMRLLDEAFSVAREAGDGAGVIEAAIAFEDVSWRPGEYGGPAVAKLRIAEELADPADPRTQARLQIALTRSLTYSGAFVEARQAEDRAVALAAELGDDEIEARVFGATLSQRIIRTGATSTAEVARFRQLADHLHDTDLSVLARQYQLYAALLNGRVREYRALLAQFRAETLTLRSRFWDYLIENHGALEAFYLGDLVVAEELAERCNDLGGAMPGEDTSGMFGLRMFLIRREQGRLAGLAPLLRQLQSSNPRDAFWAPGLAVLEAELGEVDAAVDAVAAIAELGFSEMPRDAMWMTVMTFLAEVADLTDRADWAAVLYDQMAPQSGRMVLAGHGIVCLGSADRVLGALARQQGRLEVAETHLLSAIEVDEGNGSVLFAAHGRMELARLREVQGRPREAADLARAVVDIAVEHGYGLLEQRAGPLAGSPG